MTPSLEPQHRRNLSGTLLYCKTLLIFKFFDLWSRVLTKIRPGSFFYPTAVRISGTLIRGAPLIIKIDLTNRCNLRCRMCYNLHGESPMPQETVRELLAQLGAAPVWLELLGGEPLLADELCEIIRLAKTKTAIQKILLYTNATTVTEEKAKQLKEAGLDKAIVTLTSHDAAKHDAFTGVRGSWQMTVDGIRHFVRAGVKTHTFTPLHAENIDDLAAIHEFAVKELGVTPLFFQYVPQAGDADPLKVPAERWREAKNNILGKFSQKHADVFKRMVSMCGTLCVGGRNIFHVRTDGRLTPCPFAADIVLGSITEDNLWNILSRRRKNKDFSDFISVPEGCKACSYRIVCGGGCKAGHRLVKDGYRARDYRCLGPWDDPITDKDMHDRLPNFS